MRHVNTTSRRTLIARTGRMALAALTATACWTTPAAAQDAGWPNRPIRLIVPFPAGSITDAVARVLSERLSKTLGQAVVVDNKAGANGLIGVGEVAKSAPDGYTLLVTNSSSITINPQLYKKPGYSTADLAPVTLVIDSPFILVASPDWAQKNAITSVNDLVQFATRNPGKLS